MIYEKTVNMPIAYLLDMWYVYVGSMILQNKVPGTKNVKSPFKHHVTNVVGTPPFKHHVTTVVGTPPFKHHVPTESGNPVI